MREQGYGEMESISAEIVPVDTTAHTKASQSEFESLENCMPEYTQSVIRSQASSTDVKRNTFMWQ